MSEIESAASAMSSLSTAESKEGGRTQEERDAKKAAKVDHLKISRLLHAPFLTHLSSSGCREGS